MNICIAKTYELLDPERCSTELLSHLQTAAGHGSTLAQYMLWELKYQSTSLASFTSLCRIVLYSNICIALLTA